MSKNVRQCHGTRLVLSLVPHMSSDHHIMLTLKSFIMWKLHTHRKLISRSFSLILYCCIFVLFSHEKKRPLYNLNPVQSVPITT